MKVTFNRGGNVYFEAIYGVIHKTYLHREVVIVDVVLGAPLVL